MSCLCRLRGTQATICLADDNPPGAQGTHVLLVWDLNHDGTEGGNLWFHRNLRHHLEVYLWQCYMFLPPAAKKDISANDQHLPCIVRGSWLPSFRKTGY